MYVFKTYPRFLRSVSVWSAFGPKWSKTSLGGVAAAIDWLLHIKPKLLLVFLLNCWAGKLKHFPDSLELGTCEAGSALVQGINLEQN